MTTKVTIETHDWPVAVEVRDNYQVRSPKHHAYSYGTSTEFIPANTKQDFYITNTRSIHFTELPADATDPSHLDVVVGAIGAAPVVESNETPAEAE